MTDSANRHRLRGLLDGEWVEIQEDTEASFWIGQKQYEIVGEPERGTFDVTEFDELA